MNLEHTPAAPDTTNTPEAVTLRSLARPGVTALTRLWKPFLVIQLLGLVVVVAYFQIAAFRAFCDDIAQIKARMGFVFAMLTMPIASGVVPEIVKYAAGFDRTVSWRRAGYVLYVMGLFSLAGVCVDVFYQGLSALLGRDATPFVVVGKVLIDQLLYTPVVGVLLIAVGFTFWKADLNPVEFRRRLGNRWYVNEVMPLLIPCWAYWFPMCTLMYMLPSGLTFTYGMIASAAAATILTTVATRDGR